MSRTAEPRVLYRGNLRLVDARHPCREGRPAGLVPVGGEGTALLDGRAAALLEELMREIGGWRGITAVSGWRSRKEQQAIWEESLRDHGEAFTRRYVAPPGCSEHQTGLAVDLGQKGDGVDFLRPAFPDSGLCRLFRERAPRYGFILRYPAGKEGITGIAHEPWHFRYVGTPHAEILTGLGLTLEEYLAFLRGHPAERPFFYECGGHRFALSYLPAGSPLPAQTEGKGCRMASDDNAGGCILTVWENGGEGHDLV